jgi:hypothetical protein
MQAALAGAKARSQIARVELQAIEGHAAARPVSVLRFFALGFGSQVLWWPRLPTWPTGPTALTGPTGLDHMS